MPFVGSCILGLGQTSYLSPQLITLLNSKYTRYLFQARIYNKIGTPTKGWKSSLDLELPTELVAQWDSYCLELTRVGIQLHDVEDQFIWSGEDSSGHISVKNLYSAITNSLWQNNIIGWRKNF